MSEKKKFRDTKVGGFLSKKLPAVLDIVGDVLPDKGVLGIVKNIVSTDKSLSPQDREEFARLLEMDLESERIAAQDRDSARNREIELHKAGGSNWMQYAVGIIILLSFITLIYVTLFTEVSDKEIYYFAAGSIISFMSGLIGYYFGTSKTSMDKNKFLFKQS